MRRRSNKTRTPKHVTHDGICETNARLHSRRQDGKLEMIATVYFDVAFDALVKPSSIDLVVLEIRRLQDVDEVLERCLDFTANGAFFERLHHVFARQFSRGAPCKQVANLGIGKLVDVTGRVDREVAPHVVRTAEVQLLDATCAIFFTTSPGRFSLISIWQLLQCTKCDRTMSITLDHYKYQYSPEVG